MLWMDFLILVNITNFVSKVFTIYHLDMYLLWLSLIFSKTAKQGILRGFPDLAGKIAEAGQLTKESNREHAAANLHILSDYEKELLQELNCRYKEKFGFPFVICARMNKKEAILKGLENRYGNDVKEELEAGIEQVLKICELRLRDIVAPGSKL